MTTWEPELCETMPPKFEKVSEDKYIQRKDIHEVGYHSLDHSEHFTGYECYRRELTRHEYLYVLANESILIFDQLGDDKNGLQLL